MKKREREGEKAVDRADKSGRQSGHEWTRKSIKENLLYYF
jgi:hypothetical protein